MRQFHVELYKLRFNISLVVMFLINIAAQIHFSRAGSVEEVFNANIRSNVVIIPCLYLSLLLISLDFSTRSINQSISAGIRRKGFFLTKVIVYYGIAASISMFSTLIAQYVHGGFPDKLMISQIVLLLFLRIILELGILSIPFLFVFIIREQVWAIGLNAMYMMFCLLNMSGQIKQFSLLFYFPVSMLTKLDIFSYYFTLPQLIIIPFSMMFVCITISWLVFNRSDLK